MTDQDHDGFHIKGLLINMFHYLWPELLNFDFISYMITPIVKVSLKKDIIPFYKTITYDRIINKDDYDPKLIQKIISTSQEGREQNQSKVKI